MRKRYLPLVDLVCAVMAGALWYTQGGAVWYAGQWPGPLPLVLLAIPWVLRWTASGPAWHLSALDVGMCVFLASAGVGVWAAYDSGPAWAKFWLIVGALGLCYAVAHQPDSSHLYVSLACFACFGFILSLFFLSTNNWTLNSKVSGLTALGQWISTFMPAVPGHRLNANVVGGILAAILPFHVPLMAFARQANAQHPHTRGRQVILWVGTLACAVSVLTWLLSMSRAAWFSLLSMALIWLVWRLAGRRGRQRHQPIERVWNQQLRAVLATAVVGLIGVSVLIVLILVFHLPGRGALINRLDFLRDAATLARDYAFTGAGLGMFPMQYAIYALLIHVGYIFHSHNLFLDLLIEQGVLGLGSYLAVVLTAGRLAVRSLPDESALIAQAALASLGTVLIHGLADDTLYGSRGLLMLFVPIGFVMAVATHSRTQITGRPPVSRMPQLGWGAVLAGCAIIIALAYAWRPLLGAWYANLGAVEQAQIELGHYDQNHSDNPTIDQVRQRQNLDTAMQQFEQAMHVDPANLTARQRLAEIALARRQYALAQQLLQGAWDAGHRDSVTRLLLGDAYVANGQVEAAAQVTSGLTWAARRMAGQAWSRYWVYQDYRRAADAWEAAVLLDPSDTQSARALVEATHLTGPR